MALQRNKINMSAICQNFVQNAWKKELCSNCFKSKDEHAAKPKPKPVAVTFAKSTGGIIKGAKPLRVKRNVNFNKQLVEVIGFGGEDWSDEDDDVEVYEETPDEEDVDSSGCEDEKELKRLTKANTDFNASSLGDVCEVKKSYAQLKLGKPLVDSEGRKQTLLVSVTPFGQEGKKKSHIPVARSKDEATKGVVLTSYVKNDGKEEKSLLDEITETLENGKNPIQIMGRKKIQKEIVLSVPKQDAKANKENVDQNNKRNGLSRNVMVKREDKPVVLQTAVAKIELMNSKNAKLSEEASSPDDSSSNSSTEESAKDDSDSSLEKAAFQSRELAGEPDGRADPDVPGEPPALPLTPPPPLEVAYAVPPILEKPKIPCKPATIAIRKPPVVVALEPQNVLTTFAVDDGKAKLSKQDSNGSDAKVANNKRRAPKPPEELDARERASSCSPKLRNLGNPQVEPSLPEPAPRKLLSLSSDSLVDDKKKEKRNRFSLKKFLRMGSNKDLSKLHSDACGFDELAPQPKPRLVIVHPLDLSNGKVEVVKPAEPVRGAKPPPPPRHHDDAKPLPQHPPKSAELLNKHKHQPRQHATPKQPETVYANIGEVRSSIVPNKPQRTASMREREAAQQQQQIKDNYEPVEVRNGQGENVYDYVNGVDAGGKAMRQRAESSNDVSVDYFKYQNIPRSTSLTYCGSETESEIYSPYSYYGSESEIAEDDHEWNAPGSRPHKLRSRKGRSIVHKNLEDNYGAVVIANHEALAQVLENIQQNNPIQPALRGLKTAANLRWSDFSVKTTVPPLVVGSRAFHQGLWGAQHVTLVISSAPTPTGPPTLGAFNLVPITEFSDLIPVKYLPMNVTQDVKHLQATVAVLPCTQVYTIQTYGEQLKAKTTSQTNDDAWKDASFVLLQLVNALKTLQAQGIEELPLSLTSFVLCKDMDKESHSRLCVLQGLGEDMTSKKEDDKMGTLCTCVQTALGHLVPDARLAPLLGSLLGTERAVSLTQVKSVLEFSLWGPSDVSLGGTARERELALQRWLDLQRATVLHGLVCAKVHLTVYEECHLLFLVRSNARMMCDASLLLESDGRR